MSNPARSRSKPKDKDYSSHPIPRRCGISVKQKGFPSHRRSCTICNDYVTGIETRTTAVTNLVTIVHDLQAQLDTVKKSLADALAAIAALKTETKKNSTEVKHVKETRGQDQARPLQDPTTELVITGLPYSGTDEKLDSLIQQIASTKGVQLPQGAKYFRALRRGGSPPSNGRPPRIILQLGTNAAKRAWKSDKTQITVNSLQYQGITPSDAESKQPIFLNENLSPSTRELFYHTRVFKRDHGYAYAWTSDGTVLLRKASGDPIHTIRSKADLDLLTQQH